MRQSIGPLARKPDPLSLVDSVNLSRISICGLHVFSEQRITVILSITLFQIHVRLRVRVCSGCQDVPMSVCFEQKDVSQTEYEMRSLEKSESSKRILLSAVFRDRHVKFMNSEYSCVVCGWSGTALIT